MCQNSTLDQWNQVIRNYMDQIKPQLNFVILLYIVSAKHSVLYYSSVLMMNMTVHFS